ncbi:Guanylate kinase [bacterium HR40]|nr:Guanylate kinase [bacterium HR40]
MALVDVSELVAGRRRGLMLVVSSPSGAGKTSIARGLLARDDGITMSISVTTRPPRPGERDGVDYYFVDPPTFEDMCQKGAFLEHAVVYGHRYGTPRAPVEEALAAGRDVLFDIDWQGAQQLREAAGEDMVGVFILPPSVEELERRLRRRAQDPEETVRYRLAQLASDVTHWAEYDYVLINRKLDTSIAALEAILTAERLKRRRQPGLGAFVEQFRRTPG